MRFPKEQTALRQLGLDTGQYVQFWKVTRPGVGPVNQHASDAGLPDDLFHKIIPNDGTIEDLAMTVNLMLAPAPSRTSWI
jgi:hypothetical protein